MKLLSRSKVLSLALAISASSCVVHVDSDSGAVKSSWFSDGETLRGSGVAASQMREVGEFRSVSLTSSADVRVTVGPARSVRVTTDDNLIDKVVTRVEDGRLEIGHERGNYRHKVKLVVDITTPQLVGVSIAGSGDARAEGLDTDAFKASISGSGSIRAVGRCDQLDATISGSGDLRLEDLVARSVKVRIAGSGDARVHAHDKLDVSISGSGDVRYRGQPVVTKSVAGSGSVKHE